MVFLKKKLRSSSTSGPFLGKKIELQEAIETTYNLVDYMDALKRNSPRLPKRPKNDLVYLLRCNEITRQYYTYVNLQLQGISYKRNYLTDDEVVGLFLFMKSGAKGTIFKLNQITLKFIQNEKN